MNALLLAVAFTWPAECEAAGNLYLEAARIRDSGVRLEDAVRQVRLPTARLSLLGVYARPDMSADQWKYYAIGVCIGTVGEPARQLPREERFPRNKTQVIAVTAAKERPA